MPCTMPTHIGQASSQTGARREAGPDWRMTLAVPAVVTMR